MRRASILLCTAMALLMPAPAVPEERALAIVVHPARTAALGIEDVAHIFLRKRRFWDDGAPIVALHRELGTAARAALIAMSPVSLVSGPVRCGWVPLLSCIRKRGWDRTAAPGPLLHAPGVGGRPPTPGNKAR